MMKLKFGLTMFLTFILPIANLTESLFGRMFGALFRQLPLSLQISFLLVISLSLGFILITLFIKKSNIEQRLPTQIPGSNLLLIGGIIVLLPKVLGIFTSMIQGGGASYALISLSAPLILVAKIILYIGIIKLLMAVKPHDSYVYQ